MSFFRFPVMKMLFAIVFLWLLNGTLSKCLQAQTVVAVMQNGEPVQDFVQPTNETNAISNVASEQLEPTPIAPAISNAPVSTMGCSHGSNCQCNGHANQRRTYSSYQPSHLQRKQASYWGYPEYFCEPGLGSSVSAAVQAHKSQGLIQQTTLYQCDFYPEGSSFASQLTPYGKRRLEKLACRAILTGVPLRIERCADNRELDNMRRQFIAELSAENNLGWTADMVCLVDGVPGLSGTEALIQYRNLLTQTTVGPSSAGSNNNTRGNTNASAGTGNTPTTR